MSMAMLAMLEEEQTLLMWSKTKKIYNFIYGLNVANSILDEEEIEYEFMELKNIQSFVGKNFRINVFNNNEVDFIFLNNDKNTTEKIKAQEKIDEYCIQNNLTYKKRKFPKRPEPDKLIFKLDSEEYLSIISQMMELLLVKQVL